MKSEKELSSLASDVGSLFAHKNCNAADVLVVLEMLRSDVYQQMSETAEKKEEGHKVKAE